MKTKSLPEKVKISRLNLFLALSRTTHLLLDLATPGLAALLCLGAFPSVKVLALGLLTAFSGYTAVYALNDIIDCRVDRETISPYPLPESKSDLDSVFVRHPLAQGLLSYSNALLWTIGWASLATIGAFLLNPVCPVIFLLAALLEAVYCYLLKITWLRSIVSGIVKTSGPMAATFAVNPAPPLPFLIILFLWIFFWEIGGQNVPNDLSDQDSDRLIKARTIPIRFGAHGSARIILASLAIALAMSLIMFWNLPRHHGNLYLVGALCSGFYFLILPAYRLYEGRTSDEAFHLFNRASYYPLTMLIITMLSFI